jgi:coenzyme F420-0:L-glutamate ligase/coenzyme F420-1:gamma-L-glutamate ligase
MDSVQRFLIKPRANTTISFSAVSGIPEITPGDNLVEITIKAFEESGFQPEDKDVFVFSQKIVSKSENRYIDLVGVSPSREAVELANETGKDPRFVEVVLQQSRNVLKYREDLLITVHHNGYVMANAGVDRSNLGQGGDEIVLLLPEDSDAFCMNFKRYLDDYYGICSGVLICDSVGRAWRTGTVGIALGCAGIPATVDLRGFPDSSGRILKVSEVGFADQVAAAASLVMGEADEGQPLVIVRGLNWNESSQTGQDIIRAPEDDLFL